MLDTATNYVPFSLHNKVACNNTDTGDIVDQGLKNRHTDVYDCMLKLAWRTPRISDKYDCVHFLQQSLTVIPLCLLLNLDPVISIYL